MALATDLQVVSRHLVDTFNKEKLTIIAEDNLPAFSMAVYGEPRVITQWPLLSVQPQMKVRELKAVRRWGLEFVIWVIIYHGAVASTLDIQEDTHKRIEAVEQFLLTDLKWNFIDPSDPDFNQVVFGEPTLMDHPVVLAPEQELWASSRLEVRATSEECF